MTHVILALALLVAPSPCAPGNGGLVLPDGLCATLVAEGLEGPRQLTVSPEGIVYAALGSARGTYGVIALRDTTADGVADERNAWGAAGANDVELRDGWLYLAYKDRVLRWRLDAGGMRPVGDAETVVAGLPGDKSHGAKSILFGRGDTMFVNIGAPSNSCQREDRVSGNPGQLPCPELETRAGIWTFSASRTNQQAADGVRYATGLRNAMGLDIEPGTQALFATSHGRDQLTQNWGFSDEYGAENPGEELLLVTRNSDFGWPYCYFSRELGRKVLAPEYGGDGRKIGRCESVGPAASVYPGHWAPMAIAFARGDALGAEYAEGAFIAFHGSWNRAPLPQAGYRVVFQPFRQGKPAGEPRTVASGAEGETSLRAAGVALGPDGALYISADRNGRIWKVTRR
jgi:glucose/arabinose dehydrogenase